MAANTLSQLTTANTFQHWLTATQSLIGTANTLTNGNGNTFYANTRLEVGGTGASLNVVTSAFINSLYATAINTGSLIVTGNIAQANVTDTLKVGNDALIYDTLTVYGTATMNTNLNVVGNANITGDLNVTGNINLDSIGFDDLNVSGSGAFGNNLTVTGISTLSNVVITGNVTTLNVTSNTVTQNLTVGQTSNLIGNVTSQNLEVQQTLTANILVGNANTAIYAAIAAVANSGADISVALAIALG
jgi:cytoskeletal protein CcmA (bactofilin family)